jgi:hypothetical protein
MYLGRDVDFRRFPWASIIRPTNVVVNEPTYHSSISNGLKMASFETLGACASGICLLVLMVRNTRRYIR